MFKEIVSLFQVAFSKKTELVFDGYIVKDKFWAFTMLINIVKYLIGGAG